MPTFLTTNPSDDNYWRGIILLGKNSASYKLALAKSLLELAAKEKTFITLEELAVPYALHLVEHLRKSEKQLTSKSSKFLDTCRAFSVGEKSHSELIDMTVRRGFENVIDAFHTVNDAPIPLKFFVDDRKAKKGIVLTDTLFSLVKDEQAGNLETEVEARWRLVETAWNLGLAARLLAIEYDNALQSLIVPDRGVRVNVTGCRGALNGYQMGKCFYCFRSILISQGGEANVDVDHLLPLMLSQYHEFARINLNGVWNLVLACKDCNSRKNMRLPALRYLERLHTRNQFFIESHHPLRETLILQTGQTEPHRRYYLQQAHAEATRRLFHLWECDHELETKF